MAASIRQPAVPDRSTLGDFTIPTACRIPAAGPNCSNVGFATMSRDRALLIQILNRGRISRSWTRSAHASPNSQRRTCMWTPRLDPRATFSRRVNLTTAREDTRDQIDSWNGGTHPFDGGRQRVVTLAGTVVTKIKRWPSWLIFLQCCGCCGCLTNGPGNVKRSLGVPA